MSLTLMHAWLPLTIILGAFVSEDAATLTAATLAASKVLDPRVAFISAFLGVWTSDIALYAAARAARTSFHGTRCERWIAIAKSDQAQNKVRRWGGAALLLSRLIPGTRLPTTVAAGAIEMPLFTFLTTTAIGALAWIVLSFTAIRSAGAHGSLLSPAILGIAATLGVAFLVRNGDAITSALGRVRVGVRRWSRWEFWPAGLFYAPVAITCAYLAIRYRGPSLPAIANPSQLNGGIVGESKSEILDTLRQVAPEFVAPTHLIPPGTLVERMSLLQRVLKAGEMTYPLVLKPDVGQRGAAFKRINNCYEALLYLACVRTAVVAQRYAPGPCEAGIFYYRFPNEDKGNILAITEKSFPFITGDGVRTLEQLICDDERAALIADVYLRRFATERDRVLAAGECTRLVEAGNHCQGCIFLNGSHLYSEQLRATIDAISQQLPSFYVGRYDVRYSSADELRAGRGFTIIELNGAASEATSIYDPANSLWSAYKTLFRQWRIVYTIGAANRDRGLKPPSAWSILRSWLRYRADAAAYPVAD